MKKIKIPALFIMLFFLMHASLSFAREGASYVLQGNIKGYGDGQIILSYSNPNERVTPDTIAVKNDAFILKGSVNAPIVSFLRLMNNGKLNREYYVLQFMLENAHITIQTSVNDFNNYSITGSPHTAFITNFRKESTDVIREFLKLEKAYQTPAADSKDKEQLGIEMEKKKNQYLHDLLNYKGVYNTYAGTYLLWLFSSRRISWQQLDTLIQPFDKSVRNSPYFVHMQKTVDAAKRIQPGQKAADFVVKDLDGKAYSLKDFRGHYLLMTFSASWCGPCKYEYPFLEKAYAKYADKGLKMLIMNVDDSREKWEEDVKKYHFPFPVLSDGKAFTGDLTKNYGAMSIPKIFLIDPKGEIVSSTIRQQRILDKLEEIFP